MGDKYDTAGGTDGEAMMPPSENAVPGSAGGGGTGGGGGGGGDFHGHENGGSAGGGSANSITVAATAPENTAELSFGPAFGDMQILSNAGVALYLRASAGSAADRDEELHEVYRKTQDYVNRFNTMNNPEKDQQELVDELDNLTDALTTYRKETDEGVELLLHSFEVSSLMNLMATDTTAEEALALIPSLSRFPEAAIDEILELIRGTMIRIGPRIVS